MRCRLASRALMHWTVALLTMLALPAAAQLSGGGSGVLMQLNVESVEVEGAFLRNGGSFSASIFDSGSFYITSKDGEPFFLGNSINGSYGPLRLVSGRYEPQFSSLFEPATAPRGDRVAFSSPVDLEVDQTLNLDVPTVLVRFDFRLNGSTFAIPGQIADYFLVDKASGREVNIGTNQQEFSQINVIPGTYDVIYAHREGTLIPANTRTVVLEDVLIDDLMAIEVDVRMVFRNVNSLLNGVPFPNSGLDYGHILLEDITTGASFLAGRTYEAPALLRLIPGTYRLIYSYRQSQTFSPRNNWAVLDDNYVVAPGGGTIVAEVTAHEMVPAFQMDGAAFPESGLANGRILYRAGDGSFVSLGRTHLAPEPQVMIEGSYDFFYQVVQPDPLLPVNTLTRFASGVVVEESGPLTLNVETASLLLGVQLDGEPFPASGLNYGRIVLVDSETEAEVDLGRSYDAPFMTRVILGEYDVAYRYRQSVNELTPRNVFQTVARDLEVAGDTWALVDVQTQLVAPRFSLDGADFPGSGGAYAEFFLRDENGDEVPLGESDEPASDVRVIEGLYHVDYEWQSGLGIPSNPRETIKSVFVPEPGFAAGLFASMLYMHGLGRRRSLSVVNIAAASFVLFLWMGAGNAAAQLAGGGTLPTPLPINVESVLLDGDFLLNGAPFGGSFFDGGQISLEASDGETLRIGNSWALSYGPFQLAAGRYTPLYSSFFEPATAPRGNGQAFSEPMLLEQDTTWDLDMASVQVQFSFLLNGSSFPASAGNSAEFYLRDTQSGREFLIATIADASVSVNLVPGTYDVIYAYQSGGLIPANEHAAILSDVTIDSNSSFVVDVPLVFRSFFSELNGDSSGFTGLGFGWMSLENEETGDRVFIGSSNQPQFRRLIPGEYRVIYEGREFQEPAPWNRNAVVQESLTIAPTGSTSVFFNVIAHLVEPEYFFNGAPASTSGLEFGRIDIEGSTGDRFNFGQTNQPGAAVWLIEGVYDFYYEFRETSGALPTNSNARFAEGQLLDASGPIALNINSSVITVDAELNGEAFPTSGLQFGRLRFVDTETGDEFSPGNTNSVPIMSRRLVHGTYDIVYSFREGPEFVPVNQDRVVAQDLIVDQTSSIVLNIQARLVEPSFALNGVPFPTNASDHGEIFLRDLDGESLSLGDSYAPAGPFMLIEGAYTAEYEWRAGTAVPQNGRATAQIVSVPEAGFGAGIIGGAMLLASCLRRGADNKQSSPERKTHEDLDRTERKPRIGGGKL